MALQTMVSNPDARKQLPDWARKAFHKKLDELLDMYEAGHPLWIHGSSVVTSADQIWDYQVDIYLKDWI